MRIIREQCAACDAYVATAQLKLACIRYDRLIEKDANFTVCTALGLHARCTRRLKSPP